MEPQAVAASSRPNSSSLPLRVAWGVLIVATLCVCYFSHLGALGFVGPDEPRYAWIARDMAETGDWVTPRLYRKPWFEKPPLFYWSAALCFKLFGVSEAAARLPSAICALLATLVMAWLAWRIYGAETARWLLLLLPTTVGMIGFSHAAATDMPFSGMLTMAMVCAAVVLRLVPPAQGDTALQRISASASSAATPPSPQPPTSRTSWLALILFGFFLGLAVLAKGPAGVVLCGGAILCWALVTKRWHDAFRLVHPTTILAFCVTALPWYVICARRNPEFFRAFIIEHNFKRYLTPEFQHIQPFWFYVPIVLIAFLPWTALLAWSSVTGTLRVIRQRRISPVAAFFASWSLFCLAFFSVSQSKLPGYILPAIPAIGLCVARVYVHLQPAYPLSLRFVQFLASAALLGVAAILMLFGRPSHQGNAKAAVAYGVVVLLLGVANLIVSILPLARLGDGSRSLAAGFAVLPILLLLLVSNRLLPSFFFWDPSGKTLAHELQTRRISGDSVYASHMPRAMQYGMNFYLHEETRTWDPVTPVTGFLLIRAHLCGQLVPTSWSCEEMPFDAESTGYSLYRVGPGASVSGGSSRDGRSSGSNRRGQPQ